jgi:hypothetical protein
MLVELLRLLVLRECCTPCTILVFRWCPYEIEGFLSTSRLCFGRDCEEGVTPRGEALRVLAALAARPRVRDGSREAGGGKGAVFGAINRGSGGGLVPVRSGVAIDGEEEWPRPSEDSSRGAMGRTGQQVSQCSLTLPHCKLQQLHVHAQHHAVLGPRSSTSRHTHLVTASQPGAIIIVSRGSASLLGRGWSGVNERASGWAGDRGCRRQEPVVWLE